MSNRFYNELFNTAKWDINKLLKQETPTEPSLPIADRYVAFEKVASLYLSYVKIVNKLNMCYDQMLHPQKRRLICLLLDGALARTLELKDEMVQLEFRDVQFLDNFLSRFQMVHKDLELPIPSYYQEKSEEQKENEVWVKNAFDKHHSTPLEDEQQMSVEEAVCLIQNHERAHQGKLYFCDCRERRRIEEEELRKFVKRRKKPQISEEDAAVLIQKIWRGYWARKICNEEREKEICFLGMLHLSSEEHSPEDIRKQIEDHRHILQERHEKEYQEAISDLKEHIEKEVVPDMAEKLEDDTREYFHSYKAEKDQFPVFPADEDGGSSVFFAPSEDTQKSEVSVQDASKDKKDAKGKDKGGKDKKDEKGKKGDKDGQEGFVMKPSKNIPLIQDTMAKYKEMFEESFLKEKRKAFKFYAEEFDPLETGQLKMGDCDKQVIERELMTDAELTVRQQVDALMRTELEALTKALEKDKGKKGKKKGGKKGGKKGKKGGKAGKKGKGKKEKDLTADRSYESLIEELVEQNILKEYPQIHLDDLAGSYCYHGSIIQKELNTDPDPCTGDIKRVIKECCILPMDIIFPPVSAYLHSKAPYTKSVLFAGPSGCGKLSFVHAVCTEIGATLFDLTAENIAGKYPGKPGLNMLMHLMSKMGKRMQPTVIYIEDAEKTFMKKVPKTDTTDPKRLKKNLPKFVKGIGADDRILLVGTTCLPFDVDLKGLGSAYHKVFYLAKPDYGCRRALWSEFILRYGGKITPKLDMSTLCNVSDGYKPLHLKAVVKKVLTRRRIEYLDKYPLVLTEFSSQLPYHVPVYEEEHEAYKAWLLKMPMGKKRNKLLQEEQEGDEGGGKKGKKK